MPCHAMPCHAMPCHAMPATHARAASSIRLAKQLQTRLVPPPSHTSICQHIQQHAEQANSCSMVAARVRARMSTCLVACIAGSSTAKAPAQRLPHFKVLQPANPLQRTGWGCSRRARARRP
jgi:hypothetical protein